MTFIIQKNKADIPNFNEWYQENVIDAWENDELMQWAKEARNTVEKEGDLELHSRLRVVLLFSYLEEQDVEVRYGRNELLHAGIKRLIRFARRQLPTGVANAAAIKIERSWVTSKLQSHELLQALGYVYARLFDCCWRLARHLGGDLPDSIPKPSDVGANREVGRQVQMVKLKDLETYRLTTQHIDITPDESVVPSAMRESVAKLTQSLGRTTDFDSAIAFFTAMAESTFKQWGNHVSMLFLLSRDWGITDIVTVNVADQTDKFLFWRAMAERVKIQNVHCLVFIAEFWIRDFEAYPYRAIKDLPIVGEQLQLAAFDRDGNKTIRSWSIDKTSENELARLGPMEVAERSDIKFSFFVPAMRAMGIEPDFIPKRRPGMNA